VRNALKNDAVIDGKWVETRQGIGGAQVVGSFLASAERNPRLASVRQRVEAYQDVSYNVSIVATSLRYVSALITATNWNVHAPKGKNILTDKGVPTGDKSEKPVLPGTGATPAPSAKQFAGRDPSGPADPEEDTDRSDNEDYVNLTPAEVKLAAEYAEAIRQNLRRMAVPWFKVVRQAATFKWFGHSVQEMIAQRMDDIMPGFIGIGTIENRPIETLQQWFLDQDSGAVQGWIQRGILDGTEHNLDRERCVYIVDDTLTSQPDGVGLLRHVIQLCDQLKRLEQIELWAYETDLRGVPIGYAPVALLMEQVRQGRMTKAQMELALQGIQDFIVHHVVNPELGLLLDSSPYTSSDNARTPVGNTRQWGMELVKGSGTGLAEIHAAIERKNHEIARALHTEQFMLGAGGKGSLALSEDKSRSMIELINSIIMEVAWSLEHDMIRRIFILNNWDMKLMPRLLPDAVALRSVSIITDALSKLALAGATIDRNDPIINQIRSMLKLVEQPFVTPEMIAASKPPNAGGTPGQKGPTAPNLTKDNSLGAELERVFSARLSTPGDVTPLEMMKLFTDTVNARRVS
jgi:hypothetical protein